MERVVGVKRSFDHNEALQKKMADGDRVAVSVGMREVGWFIDVHKRGDLEIRDSEVGAEHVTRQDKKRYIERVFAREHNSPALLMRFTQRRKPHYEISSGANQIRALTEFVNDAFPIQVDNEHGEKVNIHFSKLDADTKDEFLSTSMAFQQLKNISDEQFNDRINLWM
jgi:hypothetical protein